MSGRPLRERLPLTVGNERHGLNMSTTPVGCAPRLPGAALLWDLDNVASAREDLPLLAMTLSGFVDAGAARIAAAHWRVFKECRSTLMEMASESCPGATVPTVPMAFCCGRHKG